MGQSPGTLRWGQVDALGGSGVGLAQPHIPSTVEALQVKKHLKSKSLQGIPKRWSASKNLNALDTVQGLVVLE